MRELRAWLYVTLDGVVEAPENWVIGAFKLTDCHAYDNGVVSLTYQPTER
jgi:hypothetical protein